MKTNLNGYEIEGSPQEILELINLKGEKRVEKPTETKTTTTTEYSSTWRMKPIKKKKYKSRIDWDERFRKIKELMDEGMDKTEAYGKVIGYKGGWGLQRFNKWLRTPRKNVMRKYRTKEQINEDLIREVYTNPNNKTPTGILKSKKMDKLAKKTSLSRLQISQMAKKMGVVNTQKKPYTPSSVSFPKFNSVEDKYHSVLKNVLSNALEDKRDLKYDLDGFAIGIDTYLEWNEFLNELALKFNEVKKHFNKNNREMLISRIQGTRPIVKIR